MILQGDREQRARSSLQRGRADGRARQHLGTSPLILQDEDLVRLLELAGALATQTSRGNRAVHHKGIATIVFVGQRHRRAPAAGVIETSP
jgi:hypothetical protein